MHVSNKKFCIVINNNDDWKKLNENTECVDIKNDSYFGFRAMEKKVKQITYDPFKINSLIRIAKDSKKFTNVYHNLILDTDTLGFESNKSEELFLKLATRKIEEILDLNENLKLNFTIKSKGLNSNIIIEILHKIYSKNTH